MTKSSSVETFQITIEPTGRRISVTADNTLLQAARQAGLQVSAVCGGKGTCGACKVYIISGAFSELTTSEKDLLNTSEIEAGHRLACQVFPRSDGVIYFPAESLGTLQRLQLEGEQYAIAPYPALQRLDVDLSNSDPTLKQSDLMNLRETLAVIGYPHTQIPADLQVKILDLMDSTDKKASLVLHGMDLVTVLAPKRPLLGLAVDLGTTKLAAFLVDLENGVTLASEGIPNPQISYGEDVISRIEFTDSNPQGAKILQESVITGINELADRLTRQIGAQVEEIGDCVIAGNTAMHHILVGLPVHSLGTAPYLPASIQSMHLTARDLGLNLAPHARVYLPPNIAGFVGGDHVAMLLAARLRHSLKTILALDIGTNTEVSLWHKGRHLTCSCASGPAFEGAHIRHGLRAIPGAIERVFIDQNTIKVQTIADQPAIGICGSGIVDAVAEMHRAGVLNSRGSFNKSNPLLILRNGKPELPLVPAAQSGTGQEITINRQDVQQLQLAKAAIRSGIEVLLREASIRAEDIDQVLVAGAFGSYLDMANCQRIGLLPELPLERVRQVGNAAGAGTREMLLSTTKRAEAEAMLDKIEYIELTTIRDYVDLFTDAIGF